MPFPKKGSGGKREGAGRTSVKGVGDNGRSLGKEEKAEYDKARKAKSRKQTLSPKATISSEDQSDAGKVGPGRPPKSESGPMTPEEIVESNKKSVKKGRIKKKRQMAARKRWSTDSVNGLALHAPDMTLNEEDNVDSDENINIDINEENDNENNELSLHEANIDEKNEMELHADNEGESTKVNFCEDNDDENNEVTLSEVTEGKEVKPEGKFGSMSKSNWYRYLAKSREILLNNEEVVQVEVMVKLLISGEFDTMRMHLQVIEDRARKFLKDNISKLSDKQLWLRVKKMRDALLPAEEPELLLQALLKTMSSNSVQLVLLERAGVVPEPSLLGREQQAVRAAQTLAEDFVTRRRGGEEYTKVSLDHAILTIKAVGLSSKQRGDAAILATAIRCDKKFAMKLLHEVDSGTEVSLYKRSLREGAIKGTEYPKLLRQFVLEPENSRAHPGKEQVSVGRNLPKVPKRVLCRSREQIVDEFL